MITGEFNNNIDYRSQETRERIQRKGDEYAPGDDRLHNIKTAARITGNTPAQALRGMMVKHIVSVNDMIDGRTEVTPERIDEKLGDWICYLYILENVLLEQIGAIRIDE